jgi:hypothetical protein
LKLYLGKGSKAIALGGKLTAPSGKEDEILRAAGKLAMSTGKCLGVD